MPADAPQSLCPACLLQAGLMGDGTATSSAGQRDPASSPPPPGIDGYHLIEQVGVCGMGVVYKAEQREPIKRIVAVKLIKLGMDTHELIARFEGERQALAQLNHPNVAAVYHAGATDSGRPFFVMEYVPGEPITGFCDRHNYSVRQRLELFSQACEGIQHAHQKAIIHRDIKPSNLLVMLEDGKPLVKVIDFGVAKAIAGAGAEGVMTRVTAEGQWLGTPEYMSPEQAGSEHAGDVDTRTDVYSLGVVLYELLTGALPLDSVALRRARPEVAQRMICESDPPRPSARLSGAAAAEADATGVIVENADVRAAARAGMDPAEGDPRSRRTTTRASPPSPRTCGTTWPAGRWKPGRSPGGTARKSY